MAVLIARQETSFCPYFRGLRIRYLLFYKSCGSGSGGSLIKWPGSNSKSVILLLRSGSGSLLINTIFQTVTGISEKVQYFIIFDGLI
jgi:hypothetical protein